MGIKDEINALRRRIVELEAIIQNMKVEHLNEAIVEKEKNKQMLDTLVTNINLLVERVTKLERPKGWFFT